MRISAINLYSPRGLKNNAQQNNVQKNERNASPAFKGHTEEPKEVKRDFKVRYNILGKDMHDTYKDDFDFAEAKGTSPERISKFLAESIEEYKKRFSPYRTFEKTQNVTNTKLYIADPNEIVTDEIRKNHGYIVHDNQPPFPALEQLEKKYTSRTPDTHDYFKDFNEIIEYHDRSIAADEKRLEKIKKHANEGKDSYAFHNDLDSLSYQIRINEANAKILKAQGALKILAVNGDDFIQRDILVNELDYLTKTYACIDSKLKDTEYQKYMCDESLRKNKMFLQKWETELPYNARCSLYNSIRDSEERSPKLQQEYDTYVDIKHNGPARIKELQYEINYLTNKMSNDFKKLKEFYKDYKLESL